MPDIGNSYSIEWFESLLAQEQYLGAAGGKSNKFKMKTEQKKNSPTENFFNLSAHKLLSALIEENPKPPKINENLIESLKGKKTKLFNTYKIQVLII